MNEKLELVKYNTTIFNNISMNGIGTIRYGLRIAESEKAIEFVFLAEPETTGSFGKKDLFEFNRSNIAKEAVTQLVTELKKQFFDKFPDSENYFNKIESLDESKYGNYTALAVSSSSGIYMTNGYLHKRFQLIE